jgi:hypothetical protein
MVRGKSDRDPEVAKRPVCEFAHLEFRAEVGYRRLGGDDRERPGGVVGDVELGLRPRRLLAVRTWEFRRGDHRDLFVCISTEVSSSVRAFVRRREIDAGLQPVSALIWA